MLGLAWLLGEKPKVEVDRMDNRSAYEAMLDWQLEELAVRYRIPPAKRVDERGEHFYFDRERVIEALVNRDAGIPPVRSAPAVRRIVPNPKLPTSPLRETDEAGKGTGPSAEQCTRKGDISLLKKGDGSLYQSVDFPTAEMYADITPRRRQQLRTDVILEVVGKGKNRRITVDSLLAYCPPKEDAK